LYPIQIELDKVKITRKQIFNELRAQGIGVNIHYIPIHTQPYYKKLGFKNGDFPNSESFYNQSITIPLYPDMTFKQQDEVVLSLNKILQ
jgi:dTDP-4-amino-4,6-dideoxygalactose transaminase